MKIELDIKDDLIADAIEGAGCGYWADSLEFNRDTFMLTVVESEPDDGDHEEIEIDRDGIKSALMSMADPANKHVHHFKDLLARSGDMYTGDVLVQFACFGEVKYAS